MLIVTVNGQADPAVGLGRHHFLLQLKSPLFVRADGMHPGPTHHHKLHRLF